MKQQKRVFTIPTQLEVIKQNNFRLHFYWGCKKFLQDSLSLAQIWLINHDKVKLTLCNISAVKTQSSAEAEGNFFVVVN